MRSITTHILFVIIVVGLGVFSGVSNLPGDWYQSLQKPFFTPPSWLFGPAWTILYVLIGIAGARIWLRAPASASMQFWFGQLILNFLWSPAFFGLHSPMLGLMVIVALLATIIAFLILARPIDRIASLLFIPYALWVGFATALNSAIAILN